MSGKQYEPFVKEPVYQTSLRHAFSSAVSPTVTASGSFPSTADKIALSAAQSAKVMSPGGLGLTGGSVSLDDTNDRILLEPGVYRVDVSLLLVENGTDSDYHVALTTAAQAATDVSYTLVHGAVLLSGSSSHFHTVQYITVTASRALELHVAWQTAGATGTIRPGSYIEVRRVGNVEQ